MGKQSSVASDVRNGMDQPCSVDRLPFRLKALRWVGKQTWIPRGQDWLLRRIWNSGDGRRFPFEVDFFGMRYQGDLCRYIDWSVFAYGAYSYSELSLLEALALEIKEKRGSLNFFDIGANMGHHTLFMANKADAVIAFEPYPPLQDLIQEKVKLNHLDHVCIVPFALGETDQTQEYYPGGGDNFGTGTFKPTEEKHLMDPVRLEIRNGDRLCDKLNLPKIDLLKVDVEGFEPMVFRGLAERIQKDRPGILTELTDQSRSGYVSEEAFRKGFWDGAVFASVHGRNGCPFQLKPFVYAEAGEVLILPPEMAHFVEARFSIR